MAPVKQKQSKIQTKPVGKRRLEADEIATVSACLAGLTDSWTGEDRTFDECPGLSNATKEGLQAGGYVTPTEIQRESLAYSLNGMDILGAAKTGSGKTLAFLIPILETLWRNQWSSEDGLGALIISPTRELALQIFNVLKKIGCHHEFSAALLIGGGMDAKYERARLGRTNIVIGTPGRILQHMDQAPYFSTDSLMVLVLDEADRILDLGFSAQITAIIENLQNEHQTLLFSATQTKNVQDLARLSVRNPVYVSVHEHATHSTPDQLSQSYVVCKDEDKLNFLWSFIRNHLNKKVLVFLATCKQVRFTHNSFCRLRPGQTVLALHGFMNPKKRVEVFDRFCRNTTGAILLATDVASRGLDFPLVDWVVQVDCPSEASDYIHRCGRTARYDAQGQALLVLTPSQEEPMLAELARIKIPEMNKIEVNPRKLQIIQRKLQGLLAADPNLKLFAQRSFVAYIRSITMMKNRSVFDNKSIDLDALTKSYGLVVRPRLRFIDKRNRLEDSKKDKTRGQNTPEDQGEDPTMDSMDDFMSIKRPDHELEDDDEDDKLDPGGSDGTAAALFGVTKKEKPTDNLYKRARKLQRKHIIVNKKIKFNEEEEIGGKTSKTREVSEKKSRRFKIQEPIPGLQEKSNTKQSNQKPNDDNCRSQSSVEKAVIPKSLLKAARRKTNEDKSLLKKKRTSKANKSPGIVD